MLSDTLAVNGLYNRAAELAMSRASTVLKQDGFLDATQVRPTPLSPPSHMLPSLINLPTQPLLHYDP